MSLLRTFVENGQPRYIEEIKPDGLYGIRLHSETVLERLRTATLSLVLPTSNEGRTLGYESADRGPYPINRGARHRFPAFAHLLGPADRSERAGIQGYHLKLSYDGSASSLTFEHHTLTSGQPFTSRLYIAPDTVNDEQVALVDYSSTDPNVAIKPESSYPSETAQGIGELVVARATQILADISSHLRRGAEAQPANPFHNHILQRLYDTRFPASF